MELRDSRHRFSVLLPPQEEERLRSATRISIPGLAQMESIYRLNNPNNIERHTQISTKEKQDPIDNHDQRCWIIGWSLVRLKLLPRLVPIDLYARVPQPQIGMISLEICVFLPYLSPFTRVLPEP
jgi:hypothetical protein